MKYVRCIRTWRGRRIANIGDVFDTSVAPPFSRFTWEQISSNYEHIYLKWENHFVESTEEQYNERNGIETSTTLSYSIF